MSRKVRYTISIAYFRHRYTATFSFLPTAGSNAVPAIKSILGDDSVQNELSPAFEKYNEDQLSTVKLPGSSGEVIVSAHNSLGDGRYYDVESQSSFAFDHATQKASSVQSYVLESNHSDLV